MASTCSSDREMYWWINNKALISQTQLNYNENFVLRRRKIFEVFFVRFKKPGYRSKHDKNNIPRGNK